MNRLPQPGLRVAAVVATRNRPELLAGRCLASIEAQTLPPAILVVVDDSDLPVRAENERAVRALVLPETHIVYLPNYRTKGCAGALNTGLDWLHRHGGDPCRLYVATLDDDDSWSPEHVAACCARAVASDADMVVAGIVRHEPEPRRQSIPDALRADDFLVGNPHIQGSNLFVRLETLLLAGTFDEHLTACTDRDLCIKIADLGGVRYEALSVHTVHHFADGAVPRMTDPGTDTKKRGLDAFWRKYEGRMTPARRRAARARALRLFEWSPPDDEPRPAGVAEPPPEPTEPFPLVAGIATDRASRVEPLLRGLSRLSRHTALSGLDVVVLDNGPPVESRKLRRLVGTLRAEGRRIYLASRGRWRRDARAGRFGAPFEPPRRAGIALARTMVQTYVADLGERRRGAVGWILDDDMRVVDESIVAWLPEFRNRGIDVVLGAIVGAPPVPYASAVRVQMVDLLHNLAWLARLPDDAPLPNRAAENALLRERYRDYYYDLSRDDTAHLEAPFFLEPAHAGETVREARERLEATLPRILAGEQVFRPVVLPAVRSPVEAASPSDLRGGNTFMLDVGAIRDVPNLAPTLNGHETRRSDMLWALLSIRVTGRTVVRAPLPMRQDRSDVEPAGLDLDRLVADIQGYALKSALRELLKRRTGAADDLAFTPADVAWLTRFTRKYLEERLAAFSLSCWRIRGVARSLRAQGLVRSFVERIEAEYTPQLVPQVRDRVLRLGEACVREFVGGLEGRLRAFRARQRPEGRFDRQRVVIARAQVRLLAPGPLRLLGSGAEGVVLTDGTVVYKWFEDRPRNLEGLVGAWPNGAGLYRLDALRGSILTYRYEPSRPYRGGQGAGLVRLLRECRDRGVVCSNLHPDNLRVVGNAVKLVDYGRDLEPFTEKGFRHMCVRAWLTWRWHHRPDLKVLMRRALKDSELPELDGLARFLDAVSGTGSRSRLRSLLVALALGSGARRVLDYGSGKGALVRDLARAGIDVVGYDPDPSLAARWAGEARFTSVRDDALAAGPYDVVICSLVTCTIADERDYRAALSDLRAAVRDNGEVLLALCDPFFTDGGDTPLQERLLPQELDPARTFVWRKRIGPGAPLRIDVHRPLERIRRDLLRAGLVVREEREVPTVDLDRFEPAADFRILRLVPAPRAAPVSLLIKTCAMEWRTIERQVRHLVRQLEGPVAFAEVVLVVDTKADGFTRAYDTADPERHGEAVRRLVDEGLVDRVIRPEDIESLNQRWLGLATDATHSAGNAPIAAFLAGIEACRGEYVFQVDADMIVGRPEPDREYLGEMIDLLRSDPEAVTVAFPICRDDAMPWSADRPWRVEVRGCLFARARLLALRPLPNTLAGGRPELSWHRSLDQVVRAGGARSYRGGDGGFFAIHPPNARKHDTFFWDIVVDAVERGYAPALQRGNPELVGELRDWIGPKRDEPFVFVICARNVPPGRFRRCWESLIRQDGAPWGAIVIDDGSDRHRAAYLREVSAGAGGSVTFLSTRERRGQLANLVLAIRHVCVDPDTVIVTLDGDDALLGDRVLRRLAEAYGDGSDLTVGSMLRTDKHACYEVSFAPPVPRAVWQHLRTFRKRLFDSIPDELLRLDGEYVDLASDWAFMVPMALRARRPVWIREPLYLHEPSGEGKRRDQARRELVIGRLLDRLHALGWIRDAADRGRAS
ncbi:MAG: glycosyltransferase [Planctomycetaceae bacterium]